MTPDNRKNMIILFLLAIITLLLSIQIPGLDRDFKLLGLIIFILDGLLLLRTCYKKSLTRIFHLFKQNKKELLKEPNYISAIERTKTIESDEDLPLVQLVRWWLFTLEFPNTKLEWLSVVFFGAIVIIIFYIWFERIFNGYNTVEMFYFWKGLR